MRTLPLLALALLACVTTGRAPADAGDTLAIETAAVRHMLEDHPAARHGITLDASLAGADAAPGWPTAGVRDSVRTVALARALAARVVPKPVEGRGVHLVLSEPMVRGDSAWVTVTLAWHGDGSPRSAGYETRAYVIVRTDGRWQVRRQTQLGIT